MYSSEEADQEEWISLAKSEKEWEPISWCNDIPYPIASTKWQRDSSLKIVRMRLEEDLMENLTWQKPELCLYRKL